MSHIIFTQHLSIVFLLNLFSSLLCFIPFRLLSLPLSSLDSHSDVVDSEIQSSNGTTFSAALKRVKGQKMPMKWKFWCPNRRRRRKRRGMIESALDKAKEEMIFLKKTKTLVNTRQRKIRRIRCIILPSIFCAAKLHRFFSFFNLLSKFILFSCIRSLNFSEAIKAISKSVVLKVKPCPALPRMRWDQKVLL